jgi:tRNA1Val (adenine37-N6)-methyltransferase
VDIELREGERIDDLQLKGLKIIQRTKDFCFGVDAVLVANFLSVKNGDKVVDLGTGTAIIPLILSAKTKASKIIGIEVQDFMAEISRRSVILNNLEEKIEILNMDLKDAPGVLGKGAYDCVVSNPPYMNQGGGIINPRDSKAISRFEILCTLEDVVRTASTLLKSGGRFSMVHRADRIVDIIYYLRQYKLEPKRLRFVHSKPGDIPKLILIESIKDANAQLRYFEPLYIFNQDGSYSNEINKIYGRDSNE